MNQVIEACRKAATTVVEGWSDETGTTRYYEFDHIKFAHLIIEEASKIVCSKPNIGTSLAASNMRKHFGVDQ